MAVNGLNRAQQSSAGAAPQVEQAAGPAAQPSNKPVQNTTPVGYSTRDTFQAASGAGATQQVTAQANAAPQTLPHMPTFSGTITSQPVSDADKVARGAIQIDNTRPAKTYDGMYVGADGFAYPPDKFKASEVPPFTPSKPLPSPTPTTYYVNGILTSPKGADDASGEAQKLADKTGTNVVLIYNATEGAQDVLQTGLDRIGQGDNAAANTLANAIYGDLKDGKKVNVVGYSQGGAIVSHALHMVDDHISNDQGGFLANLPFLGDGNRQARAQMLSNVNAVTFAGAGRDFPDGPKYTFYVNQTDPVPNLLGVHDFNFVPDIASAVLNSIPGVSLLTGGVGYNAPGAQIYTLNDPGTDSNLFSVNGSHGINTYFGHIDNSVP